jgi:hypothetical protein
MTLAESMAIAVLKGDMVAAHALADRLMEERDEGFTAMARAAREVRDHDIVHSGYAVYHWPEFRAFCDRAGILHDLRTISVRVTVPAEGRITVEQEYAASDTASPTRPNHIPDRASVHREAEGE